MRSIGRDNNAERSEGRTVLGGGRVEDFAGTFVVTGDAGANGGVGRAVNEESADFRVARIVMGEGVEDRV